MTRCHLPPPRGGVGKPYNLTRSKRAARTDCRSAISVLQKGRGAATRLRRAPGPASTIAKGRGPEGPRPKSLPSICLSPHAPQLVASAMSNFALGVWAELLNHGFGKLAVPALFVTIAGAPRVRNAAPDRLGTPGVCRRHLSHPKPPDCLTPAKAGITAAYPLEVRLHRQHGTASSRSPPSSCSTVMVT
jgi:hypothetical protein